MEVNTGHPGVKFIEMTTGPSLRLFRIERYARRAKVGHWRKPSGRISRFTNPVNEFHNVLILLLYVACNTV